MSNKFKVHFIGKYEICYQGHTITYDDISSAKASKLLAYFIVYHDKSISTNELQELMFDNDSSTDPANALKSLVYRVRMILKKYFGDDKFILFGQSSYYWNPDIDIELDLEIFSKYVEAGNVINNHLSCENYYLKALDLFQGRLLPMFENDSWVILENVYLESSFLNIAVFMIKRYFENEKYEEVEKLCNESLKYDHLNENLHYYFIYSLLKLNKVALAKEYYFKLEKLLWDELEIHPNTRLRNLLRNIQIKEVNKQENIHDIENELINTDINGPLICSYEIFKEMYNLDLRRSSRNIKGKYFVVLTILPRQDVSNNLELYNAILESTSMLLMEVIDSLLRKGDIASKYSKNKTLIILDNCNGRNATHVVNRIIEKFYMLDKYHRVNISFKIDELKVNN